MCTCTLSKTHTRTHTTLPQTSAHLQPAQLEELLLAAGGPQSVLTWVLLVKEEGLEASTEELVEFVTFLSKQESEELARRHVAEARGGVAHFLAKYSDTLVLDFVLVDQLGHIARAQVRPSLHL